MVAFVPFQYTANNSTKCRQLIHVIRSNPALIHKLTRICETQDQKKDASCIPDDMPGSSMRSEKNTKTDFCYVDNPKSHIRQVGIADYQRASSGCKIGCICKCHAPRNLRIPSCYWFLGIFSVTLSGTSASQNPCNETSCSRQSISLMRMTYRFPAWFLRRIICLTIGVQPTGCLHATLKWPRVIPDKADIMQFAKLGT